MRIMAARHGGRTTAVSDLPALIALFAAPGEALRYDAVACARRLRSIATACTHPALTVEPLSAEEIVALFLDGVRA
jgi:hypothetical protein